MTEELPTGDEIDIDEAVKLTGLRRETLMRYKRDGKLSGRVALVEQTQRNRKLLFPRSEILKLAGETEATTGPVSSSLLAEC